MELILQYSSGVRADALLLAMTKARMRVVVQTGADTVELQNRNGRWVSEEGEPVEIDSMMAASASDWALVSTPVHPPHASAA